MKLDLEDGDIDNLFKNFDKNGDGVLQLEEFLDMVLGNLCGKRAAAVEQAFNKLDPQGK